ncbi:serine hydrolase domain-containing protein [Denitrobaculum tricleocarpae]|uniref:Serine hydrolase n=1 Tax=Denitrobaculum tricleocarpae TaxID=2591009 RepID=A0A545TM95_9PROT|nr:serine hydrolase [Denitrobaculum tricleocarpae]TQV78365.1 serine hydrolase [Denitrobaculum tricleocarpae]
MLSRKLFQNRILVKIWVVILGAVILIGVTKVFLVKAEADAGQALRLTPSATQLPGWDPQGLDEVFAYAATLSTDALVIVTEGQTLGAFGKIEVPYHVHSIRKVFLSALVGQHIGAGAGRIRLEATLQELMIDDSPQPLSPVQRTVTVRHLLKSVSGINHPAAAEAGLTAEKNRRLGERENLPGKVWAYNNWDYNALTTVFEKRTAMSVAEAFDLGIAQPLAMQDYVREDVSYLEAPERSRHKAAMFHMSARDLARFGQLYLDKGVLESRRILSDSWIERITAEAVDTGDRGLRSRHGYLWWIPDADSGLPAASFWAWGFGQQALLIIPEWRSVIVHLSDTTEFRRRFFGLIQDDGLEPQAALEKLIVLCREPVEETAVFCAKDRFVSRSEFAELLRVIANARAEK